MLPCRTWAGGRVRSPRNGRRQPSQTSIASVVLLRWLTARLKEIFDIGLVDFCENDKGVGLDRDGWCSHLLVCYGVRGLGVRDGMCWLFVTDGVVLQPPA